VQSADLCVAGDASGDLEITLGRIGVVLDRVTSADQVSVTVSWRDKKVFRLAYHPTQGLDVARLTIIDTGNGRPELLLPQFGQRVDGLFSRVGFVPLVLGQDGDRVRSVLEHVVVLGLFSGDNILGLSSNADHGVTESIDFLLALTLGRLHKHTRGDRPGDGRSCKQEERVSMQFKYTSCCWVDSRWKE
jgi:hypothetical protein